MLTEYQHAAAIGASVRPCTWIAVLWLWLHSWEVGLEELFAEHALTDSVAREAFRDAMRSDGQRLQQHKAVTGGEHKG